MDKCIYLWPVEDSDGAFLAFIFNIMDRCVDGDWIYLFVAYVHSIKQVSGSSSADPSIHPRLFIA